MAEKGFGGGVEEQKVLAVSDPQPLIVDLEASIREPRSGEDLNLVLEGGLEFGHLLHQLLDLCHQSTHSHLEASRHDFETFRLLGIP